MKLTESTLRLFKAVPIESNSRKTKVFNNFLKESIKYGFVLSPEVVANYSDLNSLVSYLKGNIGIASKALNSSFHKSWNKVKNASMEQLVLEQVFHYLTTYGKEAGFFDVDFVYIPAEKLNIPEIDIDSIPLVFIKGLTKEQLKEKLMGLLTSGIALSKNTIEDVVCIADYLKLFDSDLDLIKNKEVACILCQHLNRFPQNSVEFLRYMVYLTTGETLLIKNKALIEKIKLGNALNNQIFNYFQDYNDLDEFGGFNRLAEIFYRFKPIFLAFKSKKHMAPIINLIRKLAVHNHKPMESDYLNDVTANIADIQVTKFVKKLTEYNIFRKIRLAYALKFRTTDADHILYRVRNGKSYVTDFSFDEKIKAATLLEYTLASIAKDISKSVKRGNKTVYIPDFIDYALPATERQFSGNFPSGTFVSIPSDMVLGIHWKNSQKRSIDLDLSLISLTGKFGWDRMYRNTSREVLFSGDMTDASGPNGASEMFYLKNSDQDNFLVMVNDFNRVSEEEEVPMQVFVGKERVTSMAKNYMLNPNNLVASCNSSIKEQRQKIIGLVAKNRFYFIETNMSNAITSRNNTLSNGSKEYLYNYYVNTINLRDILEYAGYIIINNKEEADIDLSPEAISKESILEILGAA